MALTSKDIDRIRAAARIDAALALHDDFVLELAMYVVASRAERSDEERRLAREVIAERRFEYDVAMTERAPDEAPTRWYEFESAYLHKLEKANGVSLGHVLLESERMALMRGEGFIGRNFTRTGNRPDIQPPAPSRPSDPTCAPPLRWLADRTHEGKEAVDPSYRVPPCATGWTKKSVLHDDYVEWARGLGLRPLTAPNFGKALAQVEDPDCRTRPKRISGRVVRGRALSLISSSPCST